MAEEESLAARRQRIGTHCTNIADQVVPKYRDPNSREFPCHGTVAKRWQAAWDGACLALGGDPEEFRIEPARFGKRGAK